MNKNRERDDNRLDRLSSFLYQKGKLDCEAIRPIKSHVFYIQVSNGLPYILKRHTNIHILEQQWHFFEQLQCPAAVSFLRFPNQKKYIKHNGYFWTISPFIKGKKLHYANERDREQSVDVLRRFHQDARLVTVKHPLKRKKFYARWADRLAVFKKTENHFLNHGFASLFQDIVRQAENQLHHVYFLPWYQLEQNAWKNGEWNHGDVAGHNFIHGRKTRMIDFDLLAAAPELYDYVQLAQRFLPYIAWDIDKLLTYQMVSESELVYWLQATMVPSDVMREWVHFIKNRENDEISSFLTKIENDWLERQYFFKKASLMLKSL